MVDPMVDRSAAYKTTPFFLIFTHDGCKSFRKINDQKTELTHISHSKRFTGYFLKLLAGNFKNKTCARNLPPFYYSHTKSFHLKYCCRSSVAHPFKSSHFRPFPRERIRRSSVAHPFKSSHIRPATREHTLCLFSSLVIRRVDYCKYDLQDLPVIINQFAFH